MSFKFVISHGRITIKGKPIKLFPSDNKKYPTSAGWMRFRYVTWVYYIRITSRGIKVVAFHGGKMVKGTVGNPGKKPEGKPGKLPGSGKNYLCSKF